MDTTRRHLLAIGAFANAAHLSLKALRLYDRLGILRPAYIDPDNGYRYYRVEQLRDARLIRLLRQMDMPLAAIRKAVDADPLTVGRLMTEHLAELESSVQQARRAANGLRRILYYEETDMIYNVEVKEQSPQLVAGITKNVRINGLLPHIQGSLAALQAFVAAQGGALAGDPFGIYHGPVNQNDDGPMEVCFPVTGRFRPEGDVAVKELPGGALASVEIRGEQCRFPLILEAYDAVFDWITRNGYAMTGPPREIWRDDGGEHMEIAAPFQTK